MPETDISIVEIFAELVRFYGFSHDDLLQMSWLSFLGYMNERNNIVKRENQALEKMNNGKC